jgi:nitrite reductase (NO-forming)
MVVYLAAEPNRRSSETDEQDLTAIERGTSLYVTYCLQCHGPAGLGYAAQEEPKRIGAVLNQNGAYSEEQIAQMLEAGDLRVVYQSDDPVQQAMAEDWIRFRVTYGVPAEPINQNKVMPAFGNDLNVEEMNDLVYLIMNGDWNYVYNTVVHQTGVAVAEQECEENPDGEYCDDTSHAPPAYPTVPAAAPPPGAEEEASPAPTTDGESESEGSAAVSIEAQDIAFSQTEIAVKPGDTIEMTNTGQLPHDFTVDELGIKEVTPSNGDTVTITIPEDAEPGDFEFYCSVPGHKQAGMVGTLTIEAP